MNKIFRIIWSKTVNAFVVVSELASGQCKSSSAGKKPAEISSEVGVFSISKFYLNPVGVAVAVFVGTISTQAIAWQYVGIDENSGSVVPASSGGGLWENSNSVILAPHTPHKRIKDLVIIGTQASATGDSSTIVGSKAKGNGGQATALGNNAYAKAQATALGSDVYASGASSIAIGNDDIAGSGFNNTFGSFSQGTSNGYLDRLPETTIKKIYANNETNPTTALGDALNWNTFSDKYIRSSDRNYDNRIYSPTFAKGLGSIAIGSRSVAYGDGSTTLGTLSFALAKNSTAIGLRTYADFDAVGATAIGEESRVFASNTLAIGNKSEATSQGSISFGANAKAVGNGAVAIGESVLSNTNLVDSNENEFLNRLRRQSDYANASGATDLDSVKVGNANPIVQAGFSANQANSHGLKTVNARIADVLSGNFKFEVEKENQVIITTTEEVKKTKKDGEHAVSVGYYVHNSGDNSVGIGTTSAILGDNAVGIGALTYISRNAFNSLAIGVSANVQKENSISIGTATTVLGAGAVGLGIGSLIAKDNSVAIGYGVNNKAGASIGIGNGVNLEFANPNDNAFQIGIGNNANVTVSRGIAIGDSARSTTLASSVALGYRSVVDYTEAELAKPGYTARGSYSIPSSSKVGVLSVGAKGNERRIINVASGYRDSDAVTVSQLKTIEDRLDGATEKVDSKVRFFSVKSGQELQAIAQKEVDYKNYVRLKVQKLTVDARKADGEQINEANIKDILDQLKELEKKTEIVDKATNLKTLAAVSDAKYQTNGSFDIAKYMDALEAAKAADTTKDKLDNILTAEEKEKLKAGNYSNEGASQADAIAIGPKAKATAVNATAIGHDAQASTANSVALGSGSRNTARLTDAGYDPATKAASQLTTSTWKPTHGEVAVGNGTTATRRITGVAAGSADTDAVNVAQLKNVVSGTANLKYAANGTGADLFTNSSKHKSISLSDKGLNFMNGTNGNIMAVVADNGQITHTLSSTLKNITSLQAGTRTNSAKITLGSNDKNVTFNGGQLKNIANGTDNSDAVNKSQLDSKEDKFNKGNLTVDRNLKFANGGNGTGRLVGGNVEIGLADDVVAKIDKIGGGVISNTGADKDKTVTGETVFNYLSSFSSTLNLEGADAQTQKGSVDLKTQKLKVVGDNGLETTVADQTVTVKIAQDTKDKIDGALAKTEAATTYAKIDGSNLGAMTTDAKGKWRTALDVHSKAEVNTALDGKANKALDNIDNAGKQVITGLIDVQPAAATDTNPISVSVDTTNNGQGGKTKQFNLSLDKTKLNQFVELTYKAKSTGNEKVALSTGLDFNVGNNNLDVKAEANGKVTYSLNSTLTGITSIENGTNNAGAKITLNAAAKEITLNESKIKGLANGTVSADSKEAINGSQLAAATTSISNVLGSTDNGNGTITAPAFTAINGGAAPTTFKQAIENLTTAINSGLTISGTTAQTNEPRLKLGKKLQITGANSDVTITTESDNNGGVISKITVNKGTISEDKLVTGNTVKTYVDAKKFGLQGNGGDANKVEKTLDNVIKIEGNATAKTGQTNIYVSKNNDSSGLNVQLGENLTGITSISKGTNKSTLTFNDGNISASHDIYIGEATVAGNKLVKTSELTTLSDKTFTFKDGGNNTFARNNSEAKNLVIHAGDITNEAAQPVTTHYGKNLNVVLSSAGDTGTYTIGLKDKIEVAEVKIEAPTGQKAPVINIDGIDLNEKALTNLPQGNITSASKEAISGKQLKDLADKLGVSVATGDKTFDTLSFTKVEGSGATAGATNVKSAVDNLITAVNKGLVFSGNSDDSKAKITRKLGEELKIKGEGTPPADGQTAANNINVKALSTGALEIRLAKALTNLTRVGNDANNQITFGTGTADNTSSTIKVGGKDLTLTKATDGVKITGVATPTGNTDAVNKEYVDNLTGKSANLKIGANLADKTGAAGTPDFKHADAKSISLETQGLNFKKDAHSNIEVAVDEKGNITHTLNSTLTNVSSIKKAADQGALSLTANTATLESAKDSSKVHLEANKATISAGKDKSKIEIQTGAADTDNKIVFTPKNGTSVTLDHTGKLSGLASGNITTDSTDAISGKQLKDLAGKLGINVANDNTTFTAPTFTAVNQANGTAGTAATNVTAAISDLITAVNRGVKFVGDKNPDANHNPQALGSTLDIKKATAVIADSGANYKGDNLITKYELTNGNGVLSIALKEAPTFTHVTADSIGKDDNNKITFGSGDSANTNTTIKVGGNTLTITKADNDKVKVTGLANPTTDDGAATKKYVDDLLSNPTGIQLTYKATNTAGTAVGTEKKVALTSGLNFKATTNINTAVDDDGVVTHTLNNTLTGITEINKAANKGALKLDDSTATLESAKDNSNVSLTDKNATISAGKNKGKIEVIASDTDTENKIVFTPKDGKSVTLDNTGKLTGLADASLSDSSTDAVTGKQLHALKETNMTFVGNDYNEQNAPDKKVERKLGQTLSVKGEGAFTGATAANNIKVESNTAKDGLEVKLAADLVGINTLTTKETAHKQKSVLSSTGLVASKAESATGANDAEETTVKSTGVEVSNNTNKSKLTPDGLEMLDAKNPELSKVKNVLNKSSITLTDQTGGTSTKNDTNTITASKSELKDKDGNTATITATAISVGKTGDKVTVTKDGIKKDDNNNITFNPAITGTNAIPENIAIKVSGQNLTIAKATDGNGTSADAKSGISLTGLANRDISSDKYGVDANVGRAATEGALKGLADILGIKPNDGAAGNTGAIGAIGPAGKDGLDGESIVKKVDALRGGLAGNMVYTKPDGTRVQIADDGKYYDVDRVTKEGHKVVDAGGKKYADLGGGKYKEVDDKGEIKADAVEVDQNTVADLANATQPNEVSAKDIIISAVNPKDGSTTAPLAIGNLASALGLENVKPDAITTSTAIEEMSAKAAVNKLLAKNGADLTRVVTLADLQAVAQAGLTFAGNVGTDIHKKLSETLAIVGNKALFTQATADAKAKVLKEMSLTTEPGKDDANKATYDTKFAAALAETNKAVTDKFSDKNVITETKDGEVSIKLAKKPEFEAIDIKDPTKDGETAAITPEGMTVTKVETPDVNSPDKTKTTTTKVGVDGTTIERTDKTADPNSPTTETAKYGIDGAEVKDKDGNTTAMTAGGVDITDAQGNRNNIDATGLIIADDEKSNVIDKEGMTVTDADGNNSSVSAEGVNVESDKGSSTLTADKLAFSGKDGTDSVVINAADGTNGPSIDFAKAENGKDGTGKITGLADIDANETDGTIAANKNYVDDKLKDANAGQPFEYYTKEGDEKVVRGRDGKLYKESELANYKFDKDSGEYKTKDGTDGKPTALDSDNVTVKAMPNEKPVALGNIASALGKAGTDVTAKYGDTTADTNKASAVAKAKELIAGANGTGGLINQTTDLDRAVTLKDLQATAIAGLTFKGNHGEEVHRPLGTALSIVGNKTELATLNQALADLKAANPNNAADIAAAVAKIDAFIAKFSDKNLITVTDKEKNEVSIRMAERPEFKGIDLKDPAKAGDTVSIDPDGLEVVDANGNANNIGADGVEVTDENGNVNSIGADSITMSDKDGNNTVMGATGLDVTNADGNSNNISADGMTVKGKDGKSDIEIKTSTDDEPAKVALKGEDGVTDSVVLKASDGTNGGSVAVGNKNDKETIKLDGGNGTEAPTVTVKDAKGENDSVVIKGATENAGSNITLNDKDGNDRLVFDSGDKDGQLAPSISLKDTDGNDTLTLEGATADQGASINVTGANGRDGVSIDGGKDGSGPSIDFAKAENGKDGTGKITGVADITPDETDGSIVANKNYVDSKVKEATAGQPFEYAAKDDKSKVVRGLDGKLYKEADLNNYYYDEKTSSYKPRDPNGTGTPTELTNKDVVVNVMPIGENKAPIALGNIESVLGKDAPATAESAAAKVKDLIDNKDTLFENNKNKVATATDVLTLAKAGLDFGANVGDDIHRNLGEKVSIMGKDLKAEVLKSMGIDAVPADDAANKADYDAKLAAAKKAITDGFSAKNVATVIDTRSNGIVINIADKPEFKAISIKDDAMPGKTLDLTPETITMAADGNTNKMGADGLEVKDANGNTNNIGADGLDITDASGNTNSIGAAGLEISDEAGNNNNISAESINLLGANGKESNLEAGKLVLIKSAGGGDKPEAHIILEATDKGGKLTGLEARDTSTSGYGDASRAATESAVKKNRDDVDAGVVGPMVYTDNQGNRLVKADDGHYYVAKDVENGKAKEKAVAVKNPALSLANANTDRATQNAPVVLNNVAAGELAENSNQAVNGAQLHQTNLNIQNNSIRIDNLQNQVNTLDENMRAGVAQAVAHANLPVNILPGKSTLSLATGHYIGTQAFAVGYSRMSDSGKVSVKFSLGHGGKQTSVGAGIGYSW